MPPRGLDHSPVPNLVDASQFLLSLLYAQPREPAPPPKNARKSKRNADIRRRYASGEWSIPMLAREYGISNARVHQIIHRKRN